MATGRYRSAGRWRIYRTDHCGWMVGFSFTKADGRRDNVHRLAFGLGPWVLGLGWYMKATWDAMLAKDD